MKITFKSADIHELNYTREYEQGFGVDTAIGLKESKTTFTYKGILSTAHRIYIPGVILSMFEGASEHELVHTIESDFPYLQMHFEVTTSGCQYFPKGHTEPETHIYRGQHSLLFYSSLNGNLHYLPRPDSFSVEIELSLDFIKRIFNNDLGVLKEFGTSIEKNRPCIMGNKSYPITPRMKDILLDVRQCGYAGSLKKIFVEAKVIELLSLQIDQILRQDGTKVYALKKDDIDKLHHVRDIISSQLATPYSIEQLSWMAGINRTKLQEGFKEVFGDTIFGYLTHLRMEQARQFILDGKYSTIAEVANLCGYKNPQHFSAAFKKAFGYSPRELKS